MPKKNRIEQLTDDEWKELGVLLKRARGDLFAAAKLAARGAPSRETNRIFDATRRIDTARSSLEEEMFARGGPKCIHIFYGGGEQPGRECPHPNCGELE